MHSEADIIEASLTLFSRYGIKRVTMDDVAKELGISKKTIYQHFCDKKYIVGAGVNIHIENLKNKLDEIIRNSKDAIHQLIEIMEYFSEYFQNTSYLMIYDLQKYYPKEWKIIYNFKNDYMLHQVQENLKWGITEGIYRADIDIKVISKIRLLESELIFYPENFSAQQFDLRHLHTQVLTYYMHGIVSLKGHKILNKYLKIIEERD
jgi:AcrR family transcriptional regulator